MEQGGPTIEILPVTKARSHVQLERKRKTSRTDIKPRHEEMYADIL